MYESPITQYFTDIKTKVENQLENQLMEILFGLGFDVDKEELIKALKYDREKYQKGYKDGKESIVHCEDCACVRVVHLGNKFVYRCPMSTVDVEPEQKPKKLGVYVPAERGLKEFNESSERMFEVAAGRIMEEKRQKRARVKAVDATANNYMERMKRQKEAVERATAGSNQCNS